MRTSAEKKVKINISVSEQMRETLQRVATHYEISQSQLIERSLFNGLQITADEIEAERSRLALLVETSAAHKEMTERAKAERGALNEAAE